MATRPIARWLKFFAGLIFAMGLMGAGSPAATAAPAATDEVSFNMGVTPAALTLCVGESRSITVSVVRDTAGTNRFKQIHDIKVMSDIDVKASVEKSSVGTIAPGLGGLDEDLSIFTAKWDFKAIGPGRTKVNFTTLFSVYRIPGSALLRVPEFPNQHAPGAILNVTVKAKDKCKKKVSTQHTWRTPDVLLTATMDEAELAMNDQGQFSGSGTVHWTTTPVTKVFGCVTSVSIDIYAPSQVDLSGQLDDSGQLSVKLNFQPVQDTVTVYCVDLVGARSENHYTVSENPQALSVIVPASDQAVTATRSQALGYGHQNQSVDGNAVLIVEPVPEQATSAQFERQIGRLGLAGRFGFWPGAQQVLAAGAR